MVRGRLLALILLAPLAAQAQTRAVDPDDLTLTVTLEERDVEPFQQEMVLLTIHGVYKRHITRETLEQPDLAGLNWMQLGQDHWYESRVDGKTVKNMRRRMALFPDRAGTIEIGRFAHRLTLLDENDDWFEHTIRSEPLTLAVRPAPQTDGWWFPVRRLEIADNWSNAPDQLAPGEGVLRIIRVSALGAGPEMIPPMPELTSPSALIFPHPEKRLVNLTPLGPEAVAFWRWTIKPRNDVSAILEPVEVAYFDTVAREARRAVISAQRIAYLPGDAAEGGGASAPGAPPGAARLRPWPIAAAGLLAFLAAIAVFVGPDRTVSAAALRAWADRAALRRRFRRAARRGDLTALRRAARALDEAAPPDAARRRLLLALDARIFGAGAPAFDAKAFAARFRKTISRDRRAAAE